MKTTRLLLVALCGILAGLNPLSARAQTANTRPTAETESTAPVTMAKTNRNAADKPDKLSWGLDEIVKLSKAKVDESVILAFIENSETSYKPTAQDIIQLREQGVSSPVITALMRHGEGLRQTARESQKQVQAEQAMAVAAAPSPATTVYQASATYADPVSTVTVIGYPRYYSYPSYRYGYYEPSYYYPRYSYGYYPRFSLGVSFGHAYHDRYHGGGRHCR